MARTLNPAAHALRRDEFVDATQRLMQTKGFDQISVQELLSELGTSKGAFYHYFDSKAALLEAVVARMGEAALGTLQPLLDDPAVPAPAKLAGVFSGIASWKNARRDLLLRVLETWLSDDNAIVREKFRRNVAAQLTPVVTPVVAQGVAEGHFVTDSPRHTARVFVSLVLGLNEAATLLYMARQAGEVEFEEVRQTLGAYYDAFSLVLGAPPGTLERINESTLHLWFD
jgi:AcrR family transcriptional regulator